MGVVVGNVVVVVRVVVDIAVVGVIVAGNVVDWCYGTGCRRLVGVVEGWNTCALAVTQPVVVVYYEVVDQFLVD